MIVQYRTRLMVTLAPFQTFHAEPLRGSRYFIIGKKPVSINRGFSSGSAGAANLSGVNADSGPLRQIKKRSTVTQKHFKFLYM